MGIEGQKIGTLRMSIVRYVDGVKSAEFCLSVWKALGKGKGKQYITGTYDPA